jgi:protein-tyrosine phosphatase
VNVLFVCSRNKWRSRTAEEIYKNNGKFTCRSAGTEPSARIKVTAKMLLWADIIFVMEKKHQQRLSEKYEQELEGKRMVILDIEDNYAYMDSELIELIKSGVEQNINT